MSCEHEVRFTIKPTDDACRFHFDVRAYKDRIVAPDEYSGATVVTPSDMEQVLPTTDKLVREDITINPAPTEVLSTDHNGTFTPSDGRVGFSQVNVDVQPDLRPLSVSENGTYEPDGFDGYSQVSVNVPQKITADDVANATISGDITLTATTITRAFSFANMPITSVNAPNLVSIEPRNSIGGAMGGLFADCYSLVSFNAPNLKKVPVETFNGCSALTSVPFDNIETIGNHAFRNCSSLSGELLLPKIKSVGNTSFRGTGFTTVKFGEKPTMGTNVFQNCTSLTDIYVPWSQGEVANAPWGATNATIHYDTVYDENWDVVSST